jgi:tRNA/tmRNA/rRNA uracil-C5-methylase (TrmA/RlmC/RlmD family)
LKRLNFFLGAFVDGFVTVQNPKDCLHISENSKILCNEMSTFIQNSTFPVYSKESQSGFWRIIKCRENLKNEVLLMIQTTSDKEKIEGIIPTLIDHFKNDSKLNVVSIYFQTYDGVSNAAPEDSPMEKIFGVDTLEETVCGLKFKISPVSFFQVNTKGAELLYNTIKTWSSKDDILLDICSGTGTIGMVPFLCHF